MTKKRTLLFLICILSALNINATVYSGSCGDNVNYSLDTETGVFKITGTGEMININNNKYLPWYEQKSQIKSVEISYGVTSIGKYAFYGCTNLTSVNIPNSVTSIGGSVFFGCTSITSITIPNSITYIDTGTFGRSGLTKVTLNSNAIVSKIYNENSSLKDLFGNQVKEYIIGDSVTSIGSWAFYGCSNLTSVTVSNSVTTIGSYAFCGCSNLTSVIIPASVKQINEYAFSGCKELLYVYCYSRKAPTAYNKVFYESDIQFATLYVPELSVNGYKTTAPWSGFGNVLPLEGHEPIPDTEPDYIRGDVNNDGVVNMPDVMFIVNKILNGKFPDE